MPRKNENFLLKKYRNITKCKLNKKMNYLQDNPRKIVAIQTWRANEEKFGKTIKSVLIIFL